MNKKSNHFWIGTVEVVCIIFLFYSNLLMGEYTRSGLGHTKGLFWAMSDILTISNFIMAVVFATIGHFLFDYLKKKG